MRRKSQEKARAFGEAVAAGSRVIMLDALDEVTDLKGKSKERDGEDLLERAVE